MREKKENGTDKIFFGKKDIAAFGLKAVLGGGLVTLLTATLAGFLIF